MHHASIPARLRPSTRLCKPHKGLLSHGISLRFPFHQSVAAGCPGLITMPTPESAMFKARKPKVPPTFDGVDYDDDRAFKAAQDAIIREQWVGAMMVRLVGEELGKCYMREGVNHLENCGHLRGQCPCRVPLLQNWLECRFPSSIGANSSFQRNISSCSRPRRLRAPSSCNTTTSRSKKRNWPIHSPQDIWLD